MRVLFLEEDGSVLRHFLATTFGLLYHERRGRRYGLEFPRNEDLISFRHLHKSLFQTKDPEASRDPSAAFPSRWSLVLRSLQTPSTGVEMTFGWSSPTDPDLSSHLREADLVVLVSSAPPAAGEVFQHVLNDQESDDRDGPPLRGVVFEVEGHPCPRKFSSLGGDPVPMRPLPMGIKGVSRIDPALEACWEEMEKGAPCPEPRRPSGERRGFKNSGWLKDRRWWYGGGVALALVGALMVWSMLFSADSQYELGDVYYFGRGVAKNYAEAVKWYKKAAERGHAGAQNDLGWMYQKGLGVPTDYAEAVKWYKKAAEQGNVTAQYRLGYMYANGLGVKKDNAEAEKWYQRARGRGK